MGYLYEAYMQYTYGTGSGTSGNDAMEQDEAAQQDPRDPTEFTIAVLGLNGRYLFEEPEY